MELGTLKAYLAWTYVDFQNPATKRQPKSKLKQYTITEFNFEITAVHDSFDIASAHRR